MQRNYFQCYFVYKKMEVNVCCEKVLYKLLFVIFSILFTSCSIGKLMDNSNSGSLTIQYSELERTLIPDLKMDIVNYKIYGTGLEGLTPVEIVSSDSSLIIDNLYACEWVFIVEAVNENNQIVGSGSGSILIEKDKRGTLDIDVEPLSGSGILNIDLGWIKDDITNPNVTVTLWDKDNQGVYLPVTYKVDGLGIESIGNIVADGFYTMVIQLKSDENLLIGLTEKVLIIKDQTTFGSYTFNNIKESI